MSLGTIGLPGYWSLEPPARTSDVTKHYENTRTLGSVDQCLLVLTVRRHRVGTPTRSLPDREIMFCRQRCCNNWLWPASRSQHTEQIYTGYGGDSGVFVILIWYPETVRPLRRFYHSNTEYQHSDIRNKWVAFFSNAWHKNYIRQDLIKTNDTMLQCFRHWESIIFVQMLDSFPDLKLVENDVLASTVYSSVKSMSIKDIFFLLKP